MKTFIRATEIWIPAEDHTHLRFGGGLYGPLREFHSVSEEMRFAFDEGLPGKAWSSRHPIILKQFENSYFKRIEAANSAGLTCGVAMPVFAGQELTGVVVFFCGDDEEHVGAIELWYNNPDLSYEMKLVDGYYGAADVLEFNSRHTRFPHGYGLPGRVWKSNMPMLMKNLYNSSSFLRWEQATQIGINRAFGIPYVQDSGEIWVMTFLSALNTPIARRFEIWVPNANQDALVFQSGDCDTETELADDYASVAIAKGEGALGHVWQTETPLACEHNQHAISRSALAARLTSVVAIPVVRDHLKAVVALYF
jgi:hypothetical protein